MFSLVCCVAVKRCRTSSLLLMLAAAAAATFLSPPVAQAAGKGAPSDAWRAIDGAFTPPAEFADDLGDYRSPLLFNDGSQVKNASDWERRRKEILDTWHGLMGKWPPLIENPQVEILESTRRENFTQHRVRFAISPEHKTEGYLLIPEGSGSHPAVVVVYYEPETAIGMGKEDRDFALQLARRGFVCLSMGHSASFYYPNQERAELQPLSALAYASANAYHVLASREEVDPARIGIVGHSYGGKWAMFASCLYDKFACGAWSDGGVVFDESRGNVNYWEPWYLGYEQGVTRPRGIPNESRPRTGAYKQMIAEGRDLHELHALMAPRPFFVSGGSEDPPLRWKALNHARAVNRLLGYENCVGMHNRPAHSPTPESNEQIYLFFEHFLKAAKSPQRNPQP